MYSSTLPSTSALDGVGGQRHVPAALPLGKSRYPLYKETGWGPEKVWMGAENFPSPGFDPRTIQPVASSKLFVSTKVERKAYKEI
jgi:hypothetical protein